jgi:hypothetical protein
VRYRRGWGSFSLRTSNIQFIRSSLPKFERDRSGRVAGPAHDRVAPSASKGCIRDRREIFPASPGLLRLRVETLKAYRIIVTAILRKVRLPGQN